MEDGKGKKKRRISDETRLYLVVGLCKSYGHKLAIDNPLYGCLNYYLCWYELQKKANGVSTYVAPLAMVRIVYVTLTYFVVTYFLLVMVGGTKVKTSSAAPILARLR